MKDYYMVYSPESIGSLVIVPYGFYKTPEKAVKKAKEIEKKWKEKDMIFFVRVKRVEVEI